MNTYIDFKRRFQDAVNGFPIKFAFNEAQLVKGMEELGVTRRHDIYQLYAGCFIRRDDLKRYLALIERFDAEKQANMDADRTGDGFLCEMFSYELANTEYGYTRDADQAVESLGLTYDQIEGDMRLRRAFRKAKERFKEG